jgi:hypothetical protein
MKNPRKPFRLVRCKRTTFNRDWRHADAKRIHSADLTFTPVEWAQIEESWDRFLQPDCKLEDIEFVYDEPKKPGQAAKPPEEPADEPDAKSE